MGSNPLRCLDELRWKALGAPSTGRLSRAKPRLAYDFASHAAAFLTGGGGWERSCRSAANPSQAHTAQDRYGQTQVGPMPYEGHGEK